MFGYALGKKPAPLIALGSKIAATHDRLLEDQYRYALYLSDNRRFARQFIDGFPTDIQGFLDYGCGMDDVPTSPHIASAIEVYRSLVLYAMNGDQTAIDKSLLASTDGAIAESTTDWATDIASKYPHESLSFIGTLTRRQRIRVICFNMDDYYDKPAFDKFLATVPASSDETTLLADLNDIHQRCSALRSQAE